MFIEIHCTHYWGGGEPIQWPKQNAPKHHRGKKKIFLDFIILVNNYVENISDCLKSINLDELPIVPKS